jgi:hypothetical protein
MTKPEKLEPIRIIHAIIEPESVEKGTPEYIADQEFQQWVTKNAIIVLQRYKEMHERTQWTKNREKNTLIGFSGQLAFEKLLQYLKIPYDTDEPIERIRKPFDFKLSIGTIEVKSYDHYCEKAIIKESEWKGNDFLIVWKFTDDTYNRIILKGWLTKKEVEFHPITVKGESKYTSYADARVIDMSELHEPKSFLEKLPWEREF